MIRKERGIMKEHPETKQKPEPGAGTPDQSSVDPEKVELSDDQLEQVSGGGDGGGSGWTGT